MALTTTEKRILDETIRTHITELIEVCSNGGQVSAYWIRSQLVNWNRTLAYKISPSYCFASIDASLRRICEDSKSDGIHVKCGSTGCFKVFEGVDWESFYCLSLGMVERVGSIVYLYHENGVGNPFGMINFKDKTISAITEKGRIIACSPLDVSRVINLNDIFAKEWAFSYYNEVVNNKRLCPNFDLRYFSTASLPPTCPKGYIEYCYSNNLNPFYNRSLRQFNIATKLGKFWGNFIIDRIYNERYDLAVECIMKLPAEKIANRIKRELFVEGNMRALSDAETFLEDAIDYKYCLDHFVFDENRSLKKNHDALSELANREKNARLAEKLQTLNFLNGLTEAEYTIVVPQSLSDLQNEGRQQNNCVGHYYNPSILRGENLIYFIRKTNNPAHSYMTCRYSVQNGKTVEYRLVNNNSVRDNTDIAFVEKISKLIKEHLGNP